MKVAVIGAGPAGLTAAYQLSKLGFAVEVFEADPHVGGLARTLRLWNQKVDLGPHRFFSKDSRVNKVWLEVAGRDYAIVNRLSRILYRGKFYAYPLRPLNAFANLGFIESLACVFSYLRQQILPARGQDSFEEWVVHRFGRRLFEIFFKPYSEKLWGIPCCDLDADFAAQRIKNFSLMSALKTSFFHKRFSSHKTLVEQFAYPLDGNGAIYEKMASRTQANGGKIHLNCPVERIEADTTRLRGVVLSDGGLRIFDRVISTMPLNLLIEKMDILPPAVRSAAQRLKYRHTIIVYLKLEADDLFPDQWIYVHSPEFKTGRITNFRNWVPSLYGSEKGTVLAMEFWCHEDDPLWTTQDPVLIDLAKEELVRTGLTEKSQNRRCQATDGFVYRIPWCYPAYRRGYKEDIRTIRSGLDAIAGLQVIGRAGAFKYNNQDHSILMGLLAAENIAGLGAHDLWKINNDYDEYQEGSLIAETGLVRPENRA